MITPDLSKKFRRDKMRSRAGMVVGVFAAVGSLSIGLYTTWGQRYISTHGKWSPQFITSIQEQIRQLPPSQESLQKLSVAVYRRAIDDATRIQDQMATEALLLFVQAVLGVLLFLVSLKLGRLVDSIQHGACSAGKEKRPEGSTPDS